LGLWHLPAPYDEQGHYDPQRESGPLAAWGLSLNQDELLSFSPRVQEAIFAEKFMFVDAAADEVALTRLATTPGQRLDPGGWVIGGYEDLPELPEVIARCGWVLIPVAPERSHALFITAPSSRDWLVKLVEWCQRDGRNHGSFHRRGEELVLTEHPAPEPFRENARRRRIDVFLGQLEAHFGEAGPSLGSLVAEQVEARRQLRLK